MEVKIIKNARTYISYIEYGCLFLIEAKSKPR